MSKKSSIIIAVLALIASIMSGSAFLYSMSVQETPAYFLLIMTLLDVVIFIELIRDAVEGRD